METSNPTGTLRSRIVGLVERVAQGAQCWTRVRLASTNVTRRGHKDGYFLPTQLTPSPLKPPWTPPTQLSQPFSLALSQQRPRWPTRHHHVNNTLSGETLHAHSFSTGWSPASLSQPSAPLFTFPTVKSERAYPRMFCTFLLQPSRFSSWGYSLSFHHFAPFVDASN